MSSVLKVVGYIDISDAPQKHKCVCDECGNVLDDSCGDPRVRVLRKYRDGKQETIMMCPDCEFDTFGCKGGPSSIFDGTPDWIRML